MALESLNINVIHEEIRPLIFQMPYSRDIGINLFELEKLLEILENSVFNQEKIKISSLPDILKEKDNLKLLRKEVNILWDRFKQNEWRDDKISEINGQLAKLALAQISQDELMPCEQVYSTDDNEAIKVFKRLAPDLPFLELEEVGKEAEFLKEFCQEFTLETAIDILAEIDALPEILLKNKQIHKDLLNWLAEKKKELRETPELIEKIKNLPIIPNYNNKLVKLADSYWPGGFNDPLELADFINVKTLTDLSDDFRNFIEKHVAKKLTFKEYAEKFIPEYFEACTENQKAELIALLADKLKEFKEHLEIKNKLSKVKLIKCTDGIYREPGQCFMEINESAREILGGQIYFAEISDNEDSVKKFYEWLGVRKQPKIEQITKEIAELRKNNNPETREKIVNCLTYLNDCFKKNEISKDDFDWLKCYDWLPAQGRTDKWFMPEELWREDKKDLFESQGTFLDIPYKKQQDFKDFLTELGVKENPGIGQIIKHLIHCAENKIQIKHAVYRELSDKIEKIQENELEELRNKPVIAVSPGKYVFPYQVFQVFLTDNQFGKYRDLLNKDLSQYINFFRRIGVKDKPDYKDAIAVLKEISQEFGKSNKALDDETKQILYKCWEELNKALKDAQISTGCPKIIV